MTKIIISIIKSFVAQFDENCAMLLYTEYMTKKLYKISLNLKTKYLTAVMNTLN